MEHQTTLTSTPRKAKKQSKNKKKQLPLKVVYITNPMKFTATASEFRALVQELTGQDADVSDISRFAAADSASPGAAEAASEGSVHAAAEVGGGAAAAAAEMKATSADPYEDDGFCGAEMMESFLGLENCRLWNDEDVDVFKRLGAV